MGREPLKLMCVLAHPDDESLGFGGTLAKYAAEGVETYLVTATRGERGWNKREEAYPGPEALGEIREAELCAAAEVLGLQEVVLLDYIDGELDRADPGEVIGQIVSHLRRVRPHVVLTFDPMGAYGHPDHIAICQFTTAATIAAADPTYDLDPELPPHQVLKLYYMVSTKADSIAYQAALGELVMEIDGIKREATGWPEWAITTIIDTKAYWSQVWQAVSCHRSQLPYYEALSNLPEEKQAKLWGVQKFYRAFSLVNGGRQMERDLFEGIK